MQKELRLKLTLDSLKGMTISLHPGSQELVIHCEIQQDLRLSIEEHRSQILDTVKMLYASKKRDNLAIYGVR